MKLCVTYCSRKKRDGILQPDKLYDSTRIHRFTEYCKRNNLNWAILSTKYGLFFPEEKREPYDVTLKTDKKCWLGIRVAVNGVRLPTEASHVTLRRLIDSLKAQIAERSVREVVLYTWSLKQPRCYLALLHLVFDNCDRTHSWPELLECVGNHGRIHIARQLAFGR